MKKLISILLVAVLILGMFPATALTAFAADTYEKATSIAVGDTVILVCESKGMEMSTIGSQKYGEGKAYSGTPTGLVPLTVEEGYTTGTYSFKAPAGTYLYWTSGNYLQLNGNKTANTSWTVEFSSGNAVIKNAKDTSRQIQWNASSPRFSTYTSTQTAIQLYKLSTGGSTEPDVPACQHTNKVAIGEAADATCTEPGITAGEKCADCGEVITAQEELPATGHNYVDGACSVCGAEEPSVKEGNISFANTTQRTSFSTSAQVWADGDVTFTNNKAASTTNIADYSNPVRLYANSELVFAAPGNITSIVVTCDSASYATTLVSSAGSEAVANGAVVTITPTATATTYTVAKLTAQLRLDSVTVIYEGAPSAEPDCEHANQTEQDDGYAATCTEEGKTNSVVCDDCGETVVAQQTIPATNHANKTQQIVEPAECEKEGSFLWDCPDCDEDLGGGIIPATGHNYVDGFCSVCGEEKPFVSEATLSLANGTNRKSYSTTQQVYANEFITLTNDKAEATNNVYDASSQDHARFYKGSTVTIACEGMTKIVLQCDEDDYLFNLAASDDYTVTVDNTTVTVEFTAVVDTYTFTMSENQARVNSLTVTCADTSEPACTHDNKVSNEDAKAPTCVEPGQTDSYTCPDCGETIDAEPIPATGEHNYVDGFCSVCEAAEPERYYIAAHRNSEKTHYYMTNDLGDKSTKRYQATAVSGNALPSKVEAAAGYVFILIDNGDGTYSWQAEGIEGNNYLGWTSGNSGALVAEANALKLTMAITEEGYYNFSFQPEGAEKPRYLALNDNTGNNFFAWYEGSQKDLVLIPVEEIAEDETITMTLHGNSENVTVGENQVLDLNGFAATYVTGTNISVYDSTAKYTKAEDGTVTVTEGTGTLTLTEGSTVVTDNTVDGLRYIALKGENNTYTFHVLELKLSDITLRASAAGIYYKAIMNCDDTLKGAVAYHGMLVSVKNMPGADFRSLSEDGENGWTEIAGAPSGEKFTSCSVFGIFKPGRTDNTARGEMKIYANAYIQLAGTDEIIVADTSYGDKVVNEDGTKNEAFNGIAWSLKDVMQALNTKFDTLGETDQANVVKFYKAWSTAMNPWELGNIVAAATTPAE